MSHAPKPRTSKTVMWTPAEDALLMELAERYREQNWKRVAEHFDARRTSVQCLHRWAKVLKPGIRKGAWTLEEDEVLRSKVLEYGSASWTRIAQHLDGRIAKQARERWEHHLRPGIEKLKAWSEAEDRTIMRVFLTKGGRWAQLARDMPGRTDNSIKNHFNSSLRKLLHLALADGEEFDTPDALMDAAIALRKGDAQPAARGTRSGTRSRSRSRKPAAERLAQFRAKPPALAKRRRVADLGAALERSGFELVARDCGRVRDCDRDRKRARAHAREPPLLFDEPDEPDEPDDDDDDDDVLDLARMDVVAVARPAGSLEGAGKRRLVLLIG